MGRSYFTRILNLKNSVISSKTSSYSVIDGIPNFVETIDDTTQKQVQHSFGEKWIQSDFGQDDLEFEEKIKPIYLEMMGLDESNLDIFKNKTILEVGIGSGSSSRIWGPDAKEFHGIDISKAVFKAKTNLQDTIKNPILAQADVNKMPYRDESFDIVVSNGVFHHTPNTKLAVKSSLKKLKIGGTCIFYIYKIKSPIREFSDDYIRSKISNLSYDEAWKKIKPITDFGKLLDEKNIQLNIPFDLELLGIKKGTYSLQRFFYDYFFKCFWNNSWGYDYSNLVNIDWYHPKYCWRHSKNEIISWCDEFDLQIQYLKELQSGYACSVIKNSQLL
ncbi:Phthiotriol-phenolphthiotriol dimycocerosates methyltransferase 1 protein [Marine Group I thaumarchaeote SCGC AAA799-P11]|uniref:Phthiotriol-phenolphthiotriol dimycocerosates methyltransferase 1 protein n=1 Tax=Marine Group I thaumarchaeote SCGC AAA799-P11 TaxID=1502295 RepID=A0A087RZ93_9ARCH|nr:Phthiotriol-phenolphthiotriol dimycocerosates methyltransferase 1 protein [Marine Group I thaumarchaeote SCGC AAA799-P11]